MKQGRHFVVVGWACFVCTFVYPWAAASDQFAETPSEVLGRATPSDWRDLDADNSMYLQLRHGRVIVELVPQFAPQHVKAIRERVERHFFDNSDIHRVQDNFVVQWGDPTVNGTAAPSPEAAALPQEFTLSSRVARQDLSLQDVDTYAPKTGFIDGWAVAWDPKAGKRWLTHCYGTIGVAHNLAPDSGSGAGLYIVIASAARQLDRNATVVGRVVDGIELLSSLPRGEGPLGSFERPPGQSHIVSIKMGSQIAPDERSHLQILRTNTPVFSDYYRALRRFHHPWYVDPTERLDVCSIRIPSRVLP